MAFVHFCFRILEYREVDIGGSRSKLRFDESVCFFLIYFLYLINFKIKFRNVEKHGVYIDINLKEDARRMEGTIPSPSQIKIELWILASKKELTLEIIKDPRN